MPYVMNIFRRVDALIVAMLAAAIIIFAANFANAADKGKPAADASDVPYMPPAAKGWSGCGVGVHVAHASALTDTPVIGIGSSGNTAGGELSCDANFGVFLVGAFVSYDRVWSDLHTLGVDASIAAGIRAGVLASQSALLYAHGEWLRVDGSGFNSITGLGFGGGIEVKVPNAPFFVDLRYTHAMYDSAKKIGVDVDADMIRLGLKYKFSTSR